MRVHWRTLKAAREKVVFTQGGNEISLGLVYALHEIELSVLIVSKKTYFTLDAFVVTGTGP